jgi:hypothetical protein
VCIPKEEAALPTVSTESTFITEAITASEKRKVRCFDIPSTFVNTDVDKDMLMVLKGELVREYARAEGVLAGFGVGGRSFPWNRSVTNGGVLGERSVYFREASHRYSTGRE